MNSFQSLPSQTKREGGRWLDAGMEKATPSLPYTGCTSVSRVSGHGTRPPHATRTELLCPRERLRTMTPT